MEFRLLGPVEVDDEGRPLVLGGAKQRALLAILLLHANEVVSRDRLIDEIWGEHPPASAPHSLEVYVSRLRKTLHAGGEGQRLLTHAGGYLLQLEDEQLDVNRFARLVAEGRGALAAGDYDRAAGQLAEALAVWRGPALSDVAFESFAGAEIDRLEEERLAALEDRIEAELALGRHGAVVGELETLSSRHPLRERLHAQLMLSLYRSGRQAEALAVYRRTRQHLMDELGIEPSPELQRLQQKILRQDQSLELATTEPGPRPAEPGSPTRWLFPGRWRPAAIAVVIAGLLATAAAAAVALFTGSSEPSLHGVDANAVGVIDPDNGRITSEVRLDRTPSHLAAGAGSIWALSAKQESVSRIAAISGRVIQTIQVGHGPTDIAYGSKAVWVVNSLDGTVSRIDRDSNTVVDDIPVGNIPLAVATGFGSIWVTTAGDREVVRLDAHTGRVVKRIATGSVGRAIAVTDDAVWVSDDDHNRVSRIDPKSNEVTKSVTVGQGPTAVAYGAGALWVVNELDRTVMRIDPRENIVARTIPIGGTPTDLLFADGGLWVTDETGGRVVRVDPRRNEVGASIDTRNRPQGVAFAAGRLWLSVQPGAFSHRGGTLKVVSIGRTFDSLDPSLGYDGEAWNLLGMLYDGLTSFQRMGNPEGTKLVPDLATSLPVPSDDGRTYIFQLRKGIRYSNGEVVRPRDFRFALERVFALHSAAVAQHFYNALRGATRCVQRPRHCNLGSGVVTDDRANTVTFHLDTPDPEFVQKLAFHFAAPVPSGTPMRETVVPATGPYHITRFRLYRRLELARNPYFRQWSSVAAPDGFADRMHWTFLPEGGGFARKAVREVERGREDVIFNPTPVPRELVHEVQTQYATRAHAHPNRGVTYLFLNPRVPPFNDIRVRRAANYAANRSAALSASAQGLGSEPTCQILPPNFPGFSRYCPYTIHPGASEIWTGPDLPFARRLVAASGTTGMSVTIWVPCNQRSEGRVAAALMRSLGYRTRVQNVSCRLYYVSKKGFLRSRRSRAQAGVSSWFADYPAASSFMIFFCGVPGLCDRRITTDVRRALTLPTRDSYSANRFWARIDREIVDHAVAVPLITHKTLELVSRRVENYESSPNPTGVLLDQLWVK